jgi:hypothetical protein
MKRTVLQILVITSLPLSAINSSDYSFLSKNNAPVVKDIPVVKDTSTIKDEYASAQQNNDSVLSTVVVVQDDVLADEYEEYEQHVCDNAQQPAVSPTMAYLREIGCSLLIRYIVLKEQAGKYFTSVKNSVGKMLGLVA